MLPGGMDDDTKMTDLYMPAIRGFARRIATPGLILAAHAAPALAQDTTSVVPIRGLRVEVPRPTTTTGGTSAVEVSLDSAGSVAAPTMEEFLRRMPLIEIRANSRGEAQPNLRGAEDRQIAIFLDGIPLTVGWDHRTDMSVIPLTAVRKLVILRGLSSMLHGPNVLGGALEFDVARGASLQAPPPSVTGALALDQEGGTSATAAGAAFFERDFSTWVVRSGIGYRDRPGVTLPEGARADPLLNRELLAGEDGLRLNSDRRQWDGFFSTRYQGFEGTWFSGLLSGYDTDRGVPPEAHVSDPRLWRYPGQTRVFVALSGGSGERLTRFGRGDVEGSFGLDRSTTEIEAYASPAYRTPVDGEIGETLTLTGRLLGDHLFDALGEVRSALTFSDVRHTERFLSGQTFDYEQRLWSLAGEVEIESLRIAGGERGGDGESGTRWTLGAALDGSDTPRSGDKEALGTLWEWGVRTGVTRSAHGGHVLYHVGLSRRTRFPSLRELYSGALGRFQPNPGLRPESLRAAEAGMTVEADDVRFQMVGFKHHLSDGIVRSRTVTPEGVRFQRVNRDQVRSMGLEILAAAARSRFSFGGDLTLQRVRLLDPAIPGGDQPAEYEPAVSGTLNLSVDGPRRVSVNAFFRFRGAQFCESVDSPGRDELDSSATFDVEARRTFFSGRSRVEGIVGLANLADATVQDQCGLPQPGRTLRIQVNLR